MPQYWLAVGAPEYWVVAFQSKGIWGLTEKKKSLWNKIVRDDFCFFYATKPVGGIIGYGLVANKFKQNIPLWPQEIKENRIIWPYRFEINVKQLIPQDKWETQKLAIPKLLHRIYGGFQQLPEDLADEIKSSLHALTSKTEIESGHSEHDRIKDILVEIGRMQNFIAESEYPWQNYRFDVIWKKIQMGVPTYVFEVQIGGNLYQALGKLKHAYDLWNSNIYLILKKEDIPKAKSLLSGTYHEVGEKIRLIEIEKIEELYTRKKNYYDYEKELGIIV